ncbi:MAG: hypothetical protein JXQ73_33490 [Phycisphaerae bacterium]|nr:hypothetical protein [Phycisphaerae bacterium]
MKTREKKTALYLFLLIAAGTGLLIDRTYVLREGSDGSGRLELAAALRSSDIDPALLRVGPPIAAVFDSPRLKELSATALAASTDETPRRDAFGLTATMRSYYGAKSAQREEVKELEEKRRAEEAEQAAAAFGGGHQLKGTFIGQGDCYAIIDDSIFRIGDQLDGFALRRIEHYRVLLGSGQKTVELTLPHPSGIKAEGPSPR